jgi:hypothetical protein
MRGFGVSAAPAPLEHSLPLEKIFLCHAPALGIFAALGCFFVCLKF